MSQTTAFITQLTSERRFGSGERARLRALAGQGLDENTPGFDLFTGLWWPLRQKSAAAPRREVAWLVTKLYAASAVPHVGANVWAGMTLPQLLGRSERREPKAQERLCRRFDVLLQTPLNGLEPHLCWALSVARSAVVARRARGIDWVQLTDDLSIWDRGEEHGRNQDVRDIWAEQYLNAAK